MSKHFQNFLRGLALGAMLLSASCAHQNKKSEIATGEKRPLPFANDTLTHTAAKLETTPINVDESYRDDKKEMLLRSVNLPTRTSSKTTEEALKTPYPDNLLKGLPDPTTEVNVVLAFNAADLAEVVASFANPELLNFSYLIDPAVKGAITISVDTKMTAAEAWDTFEHILWLSGAYASMNTGYIHILPFEKMPQERKLFAVQGQPNVVVDFIPIRYKKSAEVSNLVKPFMTEGATITDMADANTLIIVEAPANMEKLRELITRIDNRGESAWPCGAFQCTEVDADTLVSELNSLLPVLGFPVATASGTSGGAIKVVAIPRVGCVVVSAALPEVVEEVGNWVKALDRSDLLDKEEIYFYNVEKSTASRLSDALAAFFNAEVTVSSTTSSSSRSTNASSRASSTNTSSSSTSSSNSSNSSNSRRTNSTRNSTSTSSSNKSGNQNKTVDQQLGASIFDTNVTVFADEESNRLTIKTTPRAWALIEAFLKRHDVASRQVAIKAIIAEVVLSDSTEFGVTYAASKLLSHGDTAAAGAWAGAGAAGKMLTDGTAEITSALASWEKSGLNLIIHNAGDPLAMVTAIAGEGRTKVLSEPQLVVVSGQEAKFQAGEEVAVPTQSTSYTSSSGNTSTNYEYKDIGVIMTVTPSITAGNEVRLEIEQEVTAREASDEATEGGVKVYNFTKKDVSTVMTVKDNTTILMGGMVRHDEVKTRTGIPYLCDIPVLGYLFGKNVTTQKRSEVLIMVTVNVIDPENFQDELIRRYKISLEEIAKHQEASESY